VLNIGPSIKSPGWKSRIIGKGKPALAGKWIKKCRFYSSKRGI